MIITLVVVLICSFCTQAQISDKLVNDFYIKTCPQAEKIVGDTVTAFYDADKSIAAALVRLHFHDCFIRGCDASILIDPTPKQEVETDAPGNKKSVRGFEVIDHAKAQLEKQCPGIVSCADIIAFAARDGTHRTGFTYFKVPGGRRDGRVSNVNDAKHLPGPYSTVSQMNNLFNSKGFSQEEMIVLLGAHTIGTAHCSMFHDRINYLGPRQDTTMDPDYLQELIKICPRPTTHESTVNGAQVPLDAITPYVFDNAFYHTLLANKGLLRSDLALIRNRATKSLVKKMARNPKLWADEFTRTFIKLGKFGVLTGKQGEIRRKCRVRN